jgi:uncharacterized protein
MAALLDVNALIALVDWDHVGHEAMQSWFLRHQSSGWATCPLTENGMVRVLSQATYASGQRTPGEAIGILRALRIAFEKSHQFWPDDVSISDESVFHDALIAGARLVTNVYLLGLAARHRAKLISFDRALAWEAVRGGSAELVELPR